MTDKPGLVRKAINFGKAVTRHVADGAKTVDEETYQQRLEICRNCPECILDRMVCRKCGCRLKLKARWRTQNCPLNKWPLPPDAGSNQQQTQTVAQPNPVIQ